MGWGFGKKREFIGYRGRIFAESTSWGVGSLWYRVLRARYGESDGVVINGDRKGSSWRKVK